MNFSSIYNAVVKQYSEIRAARGGARKVEDKELGGVKAFRFQVKDESGAVLNTFSRFGNGDDSYVGSRHARTVRKGEAACVTC